MPYLRLDICVHYTYVLCKQVILKLEITYIGCI